MPCNSPSRRPDWKIGLVPAAVGGSDIDDWLPGGKLFRRSCELIGTHRLSGILWHQGETNSGTEENAGRYGERFRQVVTGFREYDRNPELPVVAAELCRDLPEKSCAFHSIVSEQTRESTALLGNAAFVTSEGLHHAEDDLMHMDTPDLRELGKRYAKAYLDLTARPGRCHETLKTEY